MSNDCKDCQKKDSFVTHLIGELMQAERMVESSSAHAEIKRKLLAAAGAFWGSDWDGDPFKGGKYMGVHLCLNMNDTFCYAADAEGVPDDCVVEVGHIFDAFGQPGLTAWVALRRGIEPLERSVDEEYTKAKMEIMKAFCEDCNHYSHSSDVCFHCGKSFQCSA
jgi:hypothetical protein